FGPTIEVFRRPADLITARTFADPPLNTIVLSKRGGQFLLDGGVGLPVPREIAGIADGTYTVGFQPHHLSLTRLSADAVPLMARVVVTEISGSESFIHVSFADVRWVILTPGVHDIEADQMIEVFIDPKRLLVFDHTGRAVSAPPLGKAA
ncbi:MAG: ABC transporter ATP-binding protein, partial [Devosia sp.]